MTQLDHAGSITRVAFLSSKQIIRIQFVTNPIEVGELERDGLLIRARAGCENLGCCQGPEGEGLEPYTWTDIKWPGDESDIYFRNDSTFNPSTRLRTTHSISKPTIQT
jgi:hypothetical protein